MIYGNFTWLPRCQYGVYCDTESLEGGFERDCNEPAACHIVWGYSTTLYLCDEHATLIEEQEEATRIEEQKAHDEAARAEYDAKYDAECAEARSEAKQSKAVEKAQAEGSANADEDTQSKLLSPFN